MRYIEFVLHPIIFLMEMILVFGNYIFSSYGYAIIFLSIVITTATYPLSKYASKLQETENRRQRSMEPKLKEARRKYRGEKRFNEIERIYNYHPIKSLTSTLGLAVQLPFLLSALILLWNYQPLENEAFFALRDLSAPDALIAFSAPVSQYVPYINVLPFIMTALSFVEHMITKDETRANKNKSHIVSVVLLILIYSLPSAVLLYWTFNNLWSLLRVFIVNASARHRELKKRGDRHGGSPR